MARDTQFGARRAVGAAIREIVFVDTGVAGGAELGRTPRRRTEFRLLDADTPALWQIARHVARRRGIRALHVVTHGAQGVLRFAAGAVDEASLGRHAAALETIGAALGPNGRIALYACHAGAGRGRGLIRAMSRRTGLAVSGASGAVGSPRLGGSWRLDIRSRGVAPARPFGPRVAAAFPTLLVDLTGTAGNDTLQGESGDDRLGGGDGDDLIGGFDGHDTILGGAGNDTLRGESGDDLLHGEEGDDVVGGFDGADTISGGAGDDTLRGESGDDLIYGDDGDDVVGGFDGQDTIHGGAGNDTLSGESGDDLLYGDAGDDVIGGFDGQDTISGGAGNDLLSGHAGGDTHSGGTGADTVVGSAAQLDGDSFLDFTGSDAIRVVGAGAELSASDITLSGNTLTIDADAVAGADVTMTVSGVTASAVFAVSVVAGDAVITWSDPPPPSDPSPSENPSPPTDPGVVTVTANSSTPPPTASGLPSTNQVLTNTSTTQSGTARLVENTGNANVVTATLPPQVTLQNEGAQVAQTATQALADLVQSIDNKQPANLALQEAAASNWVSSRPAGTLLDIRTLTPSVPGGKAGTAPSEPIVFEGVPSTGGSNFQEAFVIDTSGLPSGTVISLRNIEFASIKGAVSIIGGDGENFVAGDDDVQFIVLGEGDDTLMGGGGADTVGSTTGNDILYGNQGDDLVTGGADNDTLFGGQDNDVVYGNLGGDLLYGNRESDTLYGGQGDDTLIGGQGDDLLVGGLGADRLRVLPGNGDGETSGRDTIVGFNQAEGDRLQVEAGSVASIASDASGNAVVTFVGGGTVTLHGISATEITTASFEIVEAPAGTSIAEPSPFAAGRLSSVVPSTPMAVQDGDDGEGLDQVAMMGVPPPETDPFFVGGDD